MSADQFIQYLSWAVFSVLFVVVAIRAARDRRTVALDIALFFSVPALIIAISVSLATKLLPAGRISSAVIITLFLSMVYLLLRLVSDFAQVPRWLMHASAWGLGALVLGALVYAPRLPGWLTLAMLLYLVGLLLYATVAFGRASLSGRGVTRRRMQAAAGGSLLLCLIFVISGLNSVAPAWRDALRVVSDLAGLGASVLYFLSFAPPSWLRRTWQEPELRAFLSRAASIPRLADSNAILRELEQGAATSLGAPHTRVGLWDAELQAIIFPLGDASYRLRPDESIPAAQAYREQRAIFVDNFARDHPDYAELTRRYNMRTVMAAPITAADRRFGVLVAYAPYSLIFADDDLTLMQLLADQAAVILEIHMLIGEVARVQASVEATRLKEDFLSAAAHDLKTPLTTLIARAQLLERASQQRPDAPADASGLRQIVQEGQRLRRLVLELLDAARVEQGRLVSELAEVNLVALAEEVCARQNSPRHTCTVESAAPVLGQYDQLRITQLIENLVENAITYSPHGGVVTIAVGQRDGHALLAVTDQGIGIDTADLPFIFERFYRGARVDARHYAGMGLGLFICRGIVEQHGGRIWVSSQPQQGSTFHVELPLVPVMETTYGWAADSRN